MENEISHKIIGAAIEVHRILGGPGLLEGVYESSLCHELALRGLKTERQLAVPVIYKNSVVREPLYINIRSLSKPNPRAFASACACACPFPI